MVDQTYDDYRNRIIKLLRERKTAPPGPLEEFGLPSQQCLVDGALNKKYKELIAVGIAICAQRDGGIAFHIHDAMKVGANSQEIIETIGVALLMGGGPALMHGLEALEAVNQFETAAASEASSQ